MERISNLLTFKHIFVKIYIYSKNGGVLLWHKNVNIATGGKETTLQQKPIVIKQEDIKNIMMIVIVVNLPKNNIQERSF